MDQTLDATMVFALVYPNTLETRMLVVVLSVCSVQTALTKKLASGTSALTLAQELVHKMLCAMSSITHLCAVVLHKLAETP